MVDDEASWANGRSWPEAAIEHTRAAARFAHVSPGETVLDIGCGVAGPARTLVDEFGASVYGVADQALMLATARMLNDSRAHSRGEIELELHDCQQPYSRSGFDLAWSMNMIYHVPDKQAMLRCAHDAVRPGGRIMIEDWMLTPLATDADVIELDAHFQSAAYARVDELIGQVLGAGFDLRRVEDLGHVGRTHMAKHFVRQMYDCFLPQLVADHGTEYGSMMVDEFVDGVSATIRMYRARRLTYLRLLATRD